MKPSTPDQRQSMAAFIVSVEARRGKDGKLRVYKLPPADGGGSYEVAGINDRFHPQMAAHLKHCIEQGWHDRAEADIKHYLTEYTNIVTRWTELPPIEAFLRDCAFNRGPKGALRILQIALNVPDDGKFGPITKAALKTAQAKPGVLLSLLRTARETYERRIAPPVGARAKFWTGLENRWNKAEAFARTFIAS